MVRDGDLIAIFHSIHRVMKAEKVLKAAGADILLIPVPRALTSDCGLAIRYPESEEGRVAEALSEVNLIPSEIHRYSGSEYLLVKGV